MANTLKQRQQWLMDSICVTSYNDATRTETDITNTCEDRYNCCSCGGNDCGCSYCWDCNARDFCKANY